MCPATRLSCTRPYAPWPQYTDEVGRGHLSQEEEREILDKLPAFDPLTARASRYNGILVEYFRTWPGTVVNPHPARFAAAGHQAAFLISGQPWDFAFGKGSVLERFLQVDGRILLLGSDHDAVTFLHYVEHVADFPNKRIMRFKVPVERNGERVWLEIQEVDTGEAAHENWPDRFFARIVDSPPDEDEEHRRARRARPVTSVSGAGVVRLRGADHESRRRRPRGRAVIKLHSA